MLSNVLHPILSLHGAAAYALVGVLCFGEAGMFFGFVIPGETAVLLGGVLASQHHVSLPGMIVLVVAAAILGDTVGYQVGRAFGPWVLAHRPLAGRPGVERSREFVQRRGAYAVFLGRFTAVFRALVPGIAGASGVRYRTFVLANALGGLIWGTGFTLAGYAVGLSYSRIARDASWASSTIIALVVVAVVTWQVRKRLRERRELAESRLARSTIIPVAGKIEATQIADDNEETHMALQLGDTAPDFTAESTQGTINFHEYLGDGWGILFSHPRDFTPVCTTELGEVSRLKSEFDKRNTKVVGLSVDPVDSHEGWKSDIKDATGQELNFPLLGDPDHKVADLYGMIHPNASDTMTVRSVFVIGPDKKVKLTITYPAATGRNFQEILRVLDSLQLSAQYSVATPVNWTDGEDVIVSAAMSDEDAKVKFPKGFRTVKPYLRYTPQPNK